MTRARLIDIAAFGSLALLIGAWVFQYLGYAPCKLCYWQRYPHIVAVAIGATSLVIGAPRGLAVFGALAALTTAVIGAYHAGVEQGWWEGPSSCSGDANALSGLSAADLLSTDIPEVLIMCDEIAWSFAGLSMAGWNALLSLGLALLWIAAARAQR